MSKLKPTELGESVCLKLKGKTDEGVLLEKVKRGTWVIFYKEIPGVAMGNGLFLIYPNTSKECLKASRRKRTETQLYNFISDTPKKTNYSNWYKLCMKADKRIRRYQ